MRPAICVTRGRREAHWAPFSGSRSKNVWCIAEKEMRPLNHSFQNRKPFQNLEESEITIPGYILYVNMSGRWIAMHVKQSLKSPSFQLQPNCWRLTKISTSHISGHIRLAVLSDATNNRTVFTKAPNECGRRAVWSSSFWWWSCIRDPYTSKADRFISLAVFD